MTTAVDEVINRFLKPSPGTSPQDIKNKLLHWSEIYNHPEIGITTPNPLAIAQRRRNARQNFRRLVVRHPNIAAELMREQPQEPSQEAR